MLDRQAEPVSSRVLDTAAAADAEFGEPAQSRVPAAAKALDILEFMAAAADGRTQTEIAAGVGRSIHEVYRIIQLLERRGYIARGAARDRYVLTLKLFGLVHQSPPLSTLTTAAVDPMRRLADRTRQSCHLGILTGREMTVVAQVNSPQPMFYAVTLGARFPLQETSSGLVLMAGLPADERERLLGTIAESGKTAQEMTRLRAQLQPALQAGCDVRPSLVVPGVVNVSYPVRNHVDAVVAALTVPFLPVSSDTPALDVVQAATAEAARAISATLGNAAAALGGSE